MKRMITIQHCQSEQHINGMMGGLERLGADSAWQGAGTENRRTAWR